MRDDEDGNDDMSLQNMSASDMMAELMDLMSQEGISDSKLRRILAYVERVLSRSAKDKQSVCGLINTTLETT
jgi:hypothetical protein